MLAAPAGAGEFVINPLRVTLDRNSRSSEVVVRNDDSAPLRMQVEGMSWSQDAEGKDRYTAADGLLYFPRTMEIPPGESRIVRVGVRAAPVTREATYRLFLEELPGPPDDATKPGKAHHCVCICASGSRCSLHRRRPNGRRKSRSLRLEAARPSS